MTQTQLPSILCLTLASNHVHRTFLALGLYLTYLTHMFVWVYAAYHQHYTSFSKRTSFHDQLNQQRYILIHLS